MLDPDTQLNKDIDRYLRQRRKEADAERRIAEEIVEISVTHPNPNVEPFQFHAYRYEVNGVVRILENRGYECEVK